LATETVAARGPRARRAGRLALAALLAWLGLRARWDRSMVVHLVTPDAFGHESRLLDASVDGSPDPVRAYLPNTPVGSGFFALHSESFPGRAAFCVISHPDGVVRGKTVRFIERDSHLLDALRAQTGTPIARLVVSADTVPADGS